MAPWSSQKADSHGCSFLLQQLPALGIIWEITLADALCSPPNSPHHSLETRPGRTGWLRVVKNPPAIQETWVQSLGWEDPLEKEMTTHSSILAWRIPWTEKPGRLQSVGSRRVGRCPVLLT